MFLTKEQVDFFHENGYLVIENFLSSSTVQNMKDEIRSIIRSSDLSQVQTVFTTDDNHRKIDDYFLNSGSNISFFWERKAIDNLINKSNEASESAIEPSSEEKEKNETPSKPYTLSSGLEWELALNKIGHNLHDLNSVFQKVSYDGRVGSMCEELGLKDPLLVQSMYIFKQPFIGDEVNRHRDGTFLYTNPQTCIGFWWALDNCTAENGCLYAIPGSHKDGVNRHYHRITKTKEVDGKEEEYISTSFTPLEEEKWDDLYKDYPHVPLYTPAGSLVVLHHSLVHYSSANTSPHPRHSYSIHIVSKSAEYPKENWLQRPEGYEFNEITNRV